MAQECSEITSESSLKTFKNLIKISVFQWGKSLYIGGSLNVGYILWVLSPLENTTFKAFVFVLLTIPLLVLPKEPQKSCNSFVWNGPVN